ncbi:hypothetical protein AGMMS49975_10380 [Clostridia bacterium]|nr:hypothetical protein AGMMS49975_10380 [Clostridia bacterium]
MNIDYFEKKVKEKLQELNKTDTVFFAWLCAVRALPYVGSKGNFNFWQNSKRTQHLHSIFWALDCSRAVSNVSSAASAASAAFTNFSSASASSAAYNAAYAVYNAAYAAYSAYNVYNAAYNAANAANAACVANASLREIILQDLEIIQNGRNYADFNNDLSLYGNVWNNFQKALRDIGCGYWGDLYKNIFENHFEIDKKALERRLSVPEEIRDKGANFVADYLIALEQRDAKRLNEARIIILGEKGAGKTCLARRLVDPNKPMTKDKDSTAGVDTLLWTPETKTGEDTVKIHIWDFAGHVITHAAHRFFMSERCVYIIVYDGRSEERNRLEYWLDHVKNYGGGSQTFIFVNKRDAHAPDIHINTLRERYGDIVLKEFSIEEDISELNGFRRELADAIRKNPLWSNLMLPASYFDVKEEVESLFVNKKEKKAAEFTKKEIFEKIADKHKIENAENLLDSLHALGICLWYKNLAHYKTLVLNPEWISHGVYAVINWVNDKKEHAVKLADFADIFAKESDRYPKEKHRFIFELMIHYELAYKVERQDTLVIPHLMPEDRPKTLAGFSGEETPVCRYASERPLPPDTISRFIVRHNEEIHESVWRHGVVLKNSAGQTALVREKDREICVYVSGGAWNDYLDKIRETLNDIFHSYKSKHPSLEYNIRMYENREIEPKWLDDGTLYGYAINKKDYYDPGTNKNIKAVTFVHNVNINNGTMIGGSQVGYVEKPIQSNNISLPKTLSPQDFKDFIAAMEKFLASDEARDELRGKDADKLRTLVEEAKKEEPEKGWERFRSHLVTFASVANISTAVELFLSKYSGGIADNLLKMFASLTS